MAKPRPEQDVICTRCSSPVRARPVPTFLGLPRFQCPRCHAAFTYPLTRGRRRVYVACLVVLGLFAVAALGAGRIPIPGFLPIVFGGALIQDTRARREVAEARPRPPAYAPTLPPPPPE